VSYVDSSVIIKCVNPSWVNALFNWNGCANELGYFISDFCAFYDSQ